MKGEGKLFRKLGLGNQLGELDWSLESAETDEALMFLSIFFCTFFKVVFWTYNTVNIY